MKIRVGGVISAVGNMRVRFTHAINYNISWESKSCEENVYMVKKNSLSLRGIMCCLQVSRFSPVSLYQHIICMQIFR